MPPGAIKYWDCHFQLLAIKIDCDAPLFMQEKSLSVLVTQIAEYFPPMATHKPLLRSCGGRKTAAQCAADVSAVLCNFAHSAGQAFTPSG